MCIGAKVNGVWGQEEKKDNTTQNKYEMHHFINCQRIRTFCTMRSLVCWETPQQQMKKSSFSCSTTDGGANVYCCWVFLLLYGVNESDCYTLCAYLWPVMPVTTGHKLRVCVYVFTSYLSERVLHPGRQVSTIPSISRSTHFYYLFMYAVSPAPW